jgi:hypothetical protein
MKSKTHIAILTAALIAVALLIDAWRSAKRDTAQLNAALAMQSAAIQQAEAREKQRNAQLTTALDTIAAQKRAIQTPKQALQALPSVLPPLPLPISIQIPNLSTAQPGETSPATITVPQADLKPLYDDLQDCRADAIHLDTIKKDLADEQARSESLMRERDSAIAAARGGTFWLRLKRSAKWFAIGAAVGAAAGAVARH